MPRIGSTQFALPEFSGVTRRLILWNLAAFFLLVIANAARVGVLEQLFAHAALRPDLVFSGELWQPLTYSFVHPSLLGTLFDLLSLWFIGGLLESLDGGQWMGWLYAVSVLGAAAASLLIYAVGLHFGYPPPLIPITGCVGGIFGLLIAVALLHGEMEFLLLFVINVKAKYLAAIYILIAIAQAFGEQRVYAFAQLGGALAALIYVRSAPRRGFGFAFSESWYGLRNRYFRWKRRRAASKFQVYMKKQGRTVRFDGQGRLINEDDEIDPNDKKRWN
jgi:membrane associated rhomboid family serine protease